MSALLEVNGFLFGGDLHAAYRPPSRRHEGYMENVLHKLQQLVDIANEQRLVLVMTGDILHKAKDPSELLKTRLQRIFGRCWTTVQTNVGNHDKNGLRLSDDDTLAVIGEPGAPLRVHAVSGSGNEYLVDGMRVGLGFTPYDQVIPEDVTGYFPKADRIIWVTHHDLAFDGAYPGAVVPFPITGCQLVINGHMHLEKAPITAGDTLWCNFGSIGRTAIDAVSHEPCGWSFTATGGLTRHPLEFQRNAFDLTSRLIDAASPGEIQAAHGSVFVDLLAATRKDAVPATHDGVLLLEAIMAKLDATKAPLEVRHMLLDNHRRCVERRAAAIAARV
jgi:hypothetical protein